MLACVGLSGRAQDAGPLTRAFQSRYEDVRKNLVGAAEAMPESNYGYQLTPEQRPFGEWIAHTAMGNYRFCSVVKGVAPPDTNYLHGLSAKAQLVKALEDSFGYCDAALQGMTDRKALQPVTVGDRQTAPVEGMIALLASANEHYGNLVGYLRSKQIVPPSSVRSRK